MMHVDIVELECADDLNLKELASVCRLNNSSLDYQSHVLVFFSKSTANSKVSQGAYSFKMEDWKNITHDAKDLVKKLIKKPVKVVSFATQISLR